MIHLPINTFLQGGKYRIVRFIDSGGFGCTYEAEHVMLEKKVAIKEFFVKDFCNRDETTARITIGTQSKRGLVDKLKKKFIDEAKALCRLQHPGIVSVSDVFEENGTAYFVMDYIEGQSYAKMVDKCGPLPEEKALVYIRQVAEALRVVHENHRLHLDIKPGNIMIDAATGHAILIDFGTSKQYDELDGENTSTLVGRTPGYAPLEQMGNDVVKFTPATDIYALGATFYKLLTGITPLSSNLLACGEKLEPLPATISLSTRKAIASAMQLNRNERPQTVADFLEILDKVDEAEDEITELSVSEETELCVEEEEVQNVKPVKPFMRYVKIVAVILGLFALLCLLITQIKDTPDREEDMLVSDKFYTNQLGLSFVYSGMVDDKGIPDIAGKGKYDDGSYDGKYSHGVRSGKGTFITSDGTNRFEGIFSNDKYKEGKLLILPDSVYYIGTFKDNYFENGKWYNKDGSFDAEMRNGEYYWE